jgi:hypothetical protein
VIRRSPCERYIKYLLVHPDGYSTDAVRDIVRSQGLDYLSDDHTNKLGEQLKKHKPVPFKPLNLRHGRSRRFLSKEQVYGFFHPDEPSVIAHNLLEKSRAKEVIEAMSMVGEAPAFISHRVKLLGLKCTPKAIERYMHFYWDTNLVDSTELRALMRMRTEWMQVPRDAMGLHPDQWLQYDSLKKAAYKDPRRMLMEMPVTPVAGMLGQMRLGLMPSQVDLSRIAETARNAATGRVLESMITGAPHDAARGRDYAMVSIMMSELIEKVGNPDTALQEELKKVALEMEDGPVPHIAELPSGDTFTTDMLPSEEKKKNVIDSE